MTSWFVAFVAGSGLFVLAVPRHPPRRFPEEVPGPSDPRGGAPREVSRVVVDVAARVGRPLGRRAATEVDAPRDLATCCDLLAVAAASGCTAAGAVAAVASVESGPVAGALRRVAQDVASGERLADALTAVVAVVGPAAQPLVTTLLAASSSGAPVAQSLQRLADAERVRHRRRVEARIRRLPILLLVPLVCCVLPAFVLLTLVPAALTATRGIELPSAPVPHAGVPAPSLPPAAPMRDGTDVATPTGGPP